MFWILSQIIDIYKIGFKGEKNDLNQLALSFVETNTIHGINRVLKQQYIFYYLHYINCIIKNNLYNYITLIDSVWVKVVYFSIRHFVDDHWLRRSQKFKDFHN